MNRGGLCGCHGSHHHQHLLPLFLAQVSAVRCSENSTTTGAIFGMQPSRLRSVPSSPPPTRISPMTHGKIASWSSSFLLLTEGVPSDSPPQCTRSCHVSQQADCTSSQCTHAYCTPRLRFSLPAPERRLALPLTPPISSLGLAKFSSPHASPGTPPPYTCNMLIPFAEASVASMP